LMAEVCTPEFLERAGGNRSDELLLRLLDAPRDEHFVDTMMRSDIATYLPDCLLVKVDIASMAHGLEARSPLLDHVFMEYAASLPADLKLRDGVKKYILKKAAAPLLPDEILHRRKMGFGVPLEYWFRGALRELTRDTLLGRRARERGYFKMPVVARWIDEHERGVWNWHDQLWTLLMGELWHQVYIDGADQARRGLQRPPAVA